MRSLIKRRFWAASLYSWAGLRAAWRSEEAFRLEVLLALVLWPLAFVIGNSALEIALLTASLTLVLIVELLNTALEKTIDRISLDFHPMSRMVKDMGSAAVALSIVQAVTVWLVILLG